MQRLAKMTEVEVPVSTVYNQWTQFEEFPLFMEGVEAVTRLDDGRVHWVAIIAGQRKEWDARIIEQTPDKRILWKSEGGLETTGMVTFRPLGADRTLVTLVMDYEPEKLVDALGSRLGFVSRQVEGDLKRFKEFIETRGIETGAWQRTIP